MSEQQLTQNMALRIGLASKVLPNISPAEMVGIVGDAVGLPPSEKKISGLSMDKLRTADGRSAERRVAREGRTRGGAGPEEWSTCGE